MLSCAQLGRCVLMEAVAWKRVVKKRIEGGIKKVAHVHAWTKTGLSQGAHPTVRPPP